MEKVRKKNKKVILSNLLFCSAWGQTQGITHAEYKLSYLLSKPLNLNNVNFIDITDLYLSSYFSLTFYLIIHYKSLPTILLLNLYSLDSIGNQHIKITVLIKAVIYVFWFMQVHMHMCVLVCVGQWTLGTICQKAFICL